MTVTGRPRGGSPVNDAGSNTLLISDLVDLDGDGNASEPLPYDLLGEPRRSDDIYATDTGEGGRPIVDMGAYEVRVYERWLEP